MTDTDYPTAAAEQADIVAAQGGDSAAMQRLLDAYEPAILRAVSENRTRMDADDARQAASLALIEAVHRFTPSHADARLATIVRSTIAGALNAERTAAHPVSIPSRTLTRYRAIMRKADGDARKGAELAPTFALSRETFSAVHAALYAATLDTTDEGDFPWSGEVAQNRETYEAAHAALDGMGDREREVCRYAYGFAEPRPMHDGEVADALNVSRSYAQRVRARGIEQGRAALALETA